MNQPPDTPRTTSTVTVLLLCSSLAAAVQHGWYWSQLPERVATHFGVDGQPNQWMARTPATLLLLGFQVLTPWFLVGVTALAGRLPARLVNIPHREYWLHPDRRAATLAHMDMMLRIVALCVSVFIGLIAHLTFVANRDGAPLNGRWFFGSLLTFLAIVFTTAILSLRRFRLPAA